MERIYIPKSPHEKAWQRALLQYWNPKNHTLVKEALKKANIIDLVSFERNCLIKPKMSYDRKYNRLKK